MRSNENVKNIIVGILVVLMTILVGGVAFGGDSRPPSVTRPRIVEGPAASPNPGRFIVPHRDELLWDPAAHGEWRMIYDWIDGCVEKGRVRHDMVDPLDVLAVLRLEDYLGVPWEARGILASVWCMEASMRTTGRRGGPVRGDWRNGVARAHGPAQLWPWFRNWCELGKHGADDLVGSLTCYWSRVVDRYHYRNTERCSDPWRVAEALAANGPRYLPMGCTAESSHWREMLRWR
jgi:hypothetical protein